jgi:plastocyanin
MSTAVAMRRGQVGAGIVVVLALVAVAGASPPAMPTAAAAPPPAEGCTWKRHSKQVVKRVRRHGKQRRVRRLKHWWTCQAQPAAPQSPSALSSPGSATSAPEEPQPQIGHLGVKAVEYSYTLSRPEVSAGEVIVELNNQGEDPHNLVLAHEGTEDPELEIPSTPSLSQANARLTLSPGSYRLYCSLYKHEAKGMEATLVVNGS